MIGWRRVRECCIQARCVHSAQAYLREREKGESERRKRKREREQETSGMKRSDPTRAHYLPLCNQCTESDK